MILLHKGRQKEIIFQITGKTITKAEVKAALITETGIIKIQIIKI